MENPFTKARESIGDIQSDLNSYQWYFYQLPDHDGAEIRSQMMWASGNIDTAFELCRQAEEEWDRELQEKEFDSH